MSDKYDGLAARLIGEADNCDDLAPYDCPNMSTELREASEAIKFLSGVVKSRTAIIEGQNKAIRKAADEIEQLRNYLDSKEYKRLQRDKGLMDYLASEKEYDHARALFRRNMPITRGSISTAIYEHPQPESREGSDQ